MNMGLAQIYHSMKCTHIYPIKYLLSKNNFEPQIKSQISTATSISLKLNPYKLLISFTLEKLYLWMSQSLLRRFSQIQQQIEESLMFYSPTKQFVKFSSYRTAEIKALKQRIQKQKITPDQITETQMRLLKLKEQYEGLQREDNQQLKDVYQNSQNAINNLYQEKQSMQKQVLQKARQINDLQCIRQELQEKGSLIEEQLRSEIHEKEQLVSMKGKNEQAVLLMEKQLESLTKEVSKRWEIQQQVRKAEKDLAEKWECQRKLSEQCKRQKQEILSKIMEEKEEIAKQQRQWDICEKQIQRVQISKQKSKVSEQWLKSRLQTLSILKSKKSQTEWMLLTQKQTSSGLSQLLLSITDETLRIQKEEITCQKTIKQTLIRLTQQQEDKCKLQEKISVAKANLRLLKEKNENLKNKMNNIFKSDCELIKTISNKKVYPNCKPQMIEIVKKSSAQPFASKQNLVLPISKAEKIQFAVSPRNFTQNRIL